MKVFVVMGNDFPDAVFSDEPKAEAYCIKQRKDRESHAPKIYWRVYELEIDKAS